MAKKHKFNIIDAFIVLIIIGVIAFLGVKFLGVGDVLSYNSSQKVQYVFKVQNLKDISANVLPENGSITNNEGQKMGTVVSKKVSPARWHVSLADGTFDLVERPERYDVVLEIEAEGLQKDEGFFLYGVKSIGVGSTFKLKSEGVEFEGQVMEIKK